MIVESLLELTKNTPLMRLKVIENKFNLNCELYAKLENFNLSGSIKVRPVIKMIEEFEKIGRIKNGGTLIEATSGNTGIAAAIIGKIKGYNVILTMPENMSLKRREILSKYGADVVLTPANDGMTGAVEKALELHAKIANSVIIDQFNNVNNPLAHIETAKEIINDVDLDYLIAGIGTGGTISGIAKYLKEGQIKAKIIGIEPLNSPIITQNKKGLHKIQGIGAGFIPSILDLSLIDDILTVSDEEALYFQSLLYEMLGLYVGISSGAALAASIKIGLKEENKKIVMIFPDSGDRYD